MTDVLTIIEKDGNTAKDKDPNLPAEELKNLYRTMVMSRKLDERALALQRQGRIGFYLQALGQEASHIGAAAAMKDSDWIFPSYRQPGVMLLRGVELEAIMCQLYGHDGDPAKGRQMPVHYSFRSANLVSISSPIGTQLTQAAGAGMAAMMRKEDTCIMAFIGDGGTSSNDFHAGLNFAAVYKSPCVFICENNGYAISVPTRRQTASASLAIKANAYGMPGVRVDGNDILAVYRVTKEAVDRARKGEGPTFIETVTHRMGSHSSSDAAERYRDEDEYQKWIKKDPILRFQKYLQKKKLWTEEFEKECVDGSKAKINAAIKHAEAQQRPALETLFDDVFMNLTPQLIEQRNELTSLKGPAAENVGEFPL